MSGSARSCTIAMWSAWRFAGWKNELEKGERDELVEEIQRDMQRSGPEPQADTEQEP